MDREKGMSALDCRANDTDIDCRKCDYYIRADKPKCCDFRWVLRDALALLKEPVKPKVILHGVDGISYADCPNCGKQINDDDNPYCCESCGQGIKWD